MKLLYLRTMRLLLLMMAAPVLAGDVVNRPLDGFKDLKFGMTGNQIERLGFACETIGFTTCTRKVINGRPQYEATFLGKYLDVIPKKSRDLRLKERFGIMDVDRVEVWLTEDIVNYISIIAPFSQSEVNAILTQELGEPFIYSGGEPHEKKWRHWIFANGSMLTTSPHLSMPFNSYVSYKSPKEVAVHSREELISWGLDEFIDEKAMKDF